MNLRKIITILLLTITLTTTAYALDTSKLNLKEEPLPRINKTLLNKIKKLPPPEKQTGIQNIFSEYWVEFLALIISIIGLILGITGFTISNAKKKKSVSKMINEIDNTFHTFKIKSKRCEAELYRLHDIVDEELKNGKIDESAYQLLVNRIEKYIKEIKENN